MRTVILGERPPELEAFLERRRQLGQDTHDEVWEGAYHLAAIAHSDHGLVQAEVLFALTGRAKRLGLVALTGCNIGDPSDFRVPDGVLCATAPHVVYVPTALLVVEVLSPDDESFAKLPFYAARGIHDVVIAHPQERWVRCYDLRSGEAVLSDRSSVLDLPMAQLAAEITWP
jgi:Uma2 family endonuclease